MNTSSTIHDPVSANSPGTAASNRRQIIFQLTAAVALAIALLVIVVIDRTWSVAAGSSSSAGVSVVEEKSKPLEVATKVKPMRLAVTKPQFDDMGKLLTMLGDGYKYATIEANDMLDEKKVMSFDVIFFTCDGVDQSWVESTLGSAERDAQHVILKPEVETKFRDTVRKFVESGGVLYASDWRIPMVVRAFPEYANPALFFSGVSQEVRAEVVNAALQELLGSNHIDLLFDLSGWHSAPFSGRDVEVIMRGEFRTTGPERGDAPLLVKIRHGKGTIIVTSFHNEKENSETALELLKFLVFSSLTSRVENEVTEEMIRGGFSPQRGSLLTTTSDNPSVTREYQCLVDGNLSFVLAFENQGARLHLLVTAPDGKTWKREGDSSFQIDVENAQKGTWRYTVTAKKVPFPNFPFKLSVWSK